MTGRHRFTLSALAVTIVGLLFALSASAQQKMPSTSKQSDVKAGILTCNVESGWGFVFGSSRNIKCNYSPKPNVNEHYTGKIKKFGVDIGYVQSAIMVWAVLAPTTDLTPGALTGDYGGVTGGASIGVGVGANVLVGGSKQSISLQPLSIEGNTGLNVAAGIAALSLKYQR